MARPRQFDEDTVLDAAMAVFWDKGYEATSIVDLMAAMNLKKGSIYKAFTDKRTLFMTALNRYMERHYAQFRDLLEGHESPMIALEHVFAAIVDDHPDNKVSGCFMVNAIVELAPHDEDVKIILQRQVARIEQLLHDTVFQGQGMGEIRADRAAEDLAETLMVFIQGLQTDLRCGFGAEKTGRLVRCILADMRPRPFLTHTTSRAA